MSVPDIARPAYPSPLVGAPSNLSGALTANQPLLPVTAPLLLGSPPRRACAAPV